MPSLKHLSSTQQRRLKALLYKFEHLFDGTLGDWNMEPVSCMPKEGTTPFNYHRFRCPKFMRKHSRRKYNTFAN
jgi:hypothetical protein